MVKYCNWLAILPCLLGITFLSGCLTWNATTGMTVDGAGKVGISVLTPIGINFNADDRNAAQFLVSPEFTYDGDPRVQGTMSLLYARQPGGEGHAYRGGLFWTMIDHNLETGGASQHVGLRFTHLYGNWITTPKEDRVDPPGWFGVGPSLELSRRFSKTENYSSELEHYRLRIGVAVELITLTKCAMQFNCAQEERE